MWTYRTLDRNITTLYYHRMLSSQTRDIVEQQLFASQYMNYLPSEKELEKEIDFQKELFLSQQKKKIKK